MAIKPVEEQKIVIPAMNLMRIGVRIEGTEPLIFHKWSEKAKKQMRDKQAKKASKGREIREPESEYLESFYYDSHGNIAFPALSLKQALVGAARSIDGISMAELRGWVRVLGDVDGFIPVLVNDKPIKPSKPKLEGDFPENIFGIDPKIPEITMREDTVRVGMGTADLRYRGQIKNWSMRFLVEFNANKLSPEMVLNLIQYAGFSSGVGEWRPEKNGISGTFKVSNTSEESL